MENGKKQYWCVMSEFHNNGTVLTGISSRVCRDMPRNRYKRTPVMDAYVDWFSSYSEAEAFLAEAKTA